MARSITLQRWQPDGQPESARRRLAWQGELPDADAVEALAPDCPRAFRKQLMDSLARVALRDSWIKLPGEELPAVPPSARLVIATFARGDLAANHAWCVIIERDDEGEGDDELDYLMAFFRARRRFLPAPGERVSSECDLEVRGIPGFLLPSLLVSADGPLGPVAAKSPLPFKADQTTRKVSVDPRSSRAEGPLLLLTVDLSLGGRTTRLLPAAMSDIFWRGPLWQFEELAWPSRPADAARTDPLAASAVVGRRKELTDLLGAARYRFSGNLPGNADARGKLEVWATERLPVRSRRGRFLAARRPLARFPLHIEGDSLTITAPQSQDVRTRSERLFDDFPAFFVSPVVPLSLGRGLLLPTGEGNELLGTPRLRVVVPDAARLGEAELHALVCDGVILNPQGDLPVALPVDHDRLLLRALFPTRQRPHLLSATLQVRRGDEAPIQLPVQPVGDPREVADGFLLDLDLGAALADPGRFEGTPSMLWVAPVLRYRFGTTAPQESQLAGFRCCLLPSLIEVRREEGTTLVLSRPADGVFARGLRLELRDHPGSHGPPDDVVSGFDVPEGLDLFIRSQSGARVDAPRFLRARWGELLLP